MATVEQELTVKDRVTDALFTLRYERGKFTERFWMGVSDRLPGKLRFWTFVRVAADTTTSPHLAGWAVPNVSLMAALKVAGHQLMEPEPSLDGMPMLGMLVYLPTHGHGEDEPCGTYCAVRQWNAHTLANGNPYPQTSA